jgi:hypothetical protein
MAKRRTREQIDADQIIKKRLNELGEAILKEAVPESRRDTGNLQDTMNFFVRPDTTLTMTQAFYGRFNYPRGVEAGRKNALLLVVERLVPDTTKIIVKDINDRILKPFKDDSNT